MLPARLSLMIRCRTIRMAGPRDPMSHCLCSSEPVTLNVFTPSPFYVDAFVSLAVLGYCFGLLALFQGPATAIDTLKKTFSTKSSGAKSKKQ